MKQKYRELLNYLLDLSAEASTWRGVITILAMLGLTGATQWDLGQVAFAGAVISQVLKIVLKDKLKAE